MSFATPYDIVNRGLQLIGVPRIVNFSDQSKQAVEANFIYDKLRAAELRRFVWTFSTRRAVLRPNTGTIQQVLWPTYSAATTYAAADVVLDSAGFPYIGLRASNTGNTPSAPTVNPYWEAYSGPQFADTYSNTTTYYPGDLAVSGGTVYLFINGAATAGQTPPNTTYWHAPQGATLSGLVSISPLGYNPQSGATGRLLYRLPANFLRMAPQDPKQPGVSRLGVSAGMMFNDWEIESGYISSAALTGDVILRFVADTVVVATWEPLFCDALAARVAMSLNETMTQKTELFQRAAQVYTAAVRTARQVSLLEGGSTEQDFEDQLAQAVAQQPQRG